MILGVDIETCSAADIDDGAAPYAEHPSTRVYVVVFAFSARRGDARTFRWVPGMQLPGWIREWIEQGHPVLAHNASFEASIFKSILGPAYSFPVPTADQWLDSLAIAASLNLPLALGNLGPAIGAAALKDAEGHALMKELAKVKKKQGVYVYPATTPEKLERLTLYCERDVLSMIDCFWKMPRLPDAEQRMIVEDRRINMRGALLNQQLAAGMEVMASEREREIAAAIWEQTHDLLGVTNVPALTSWLKDRGVLLPKVVRKKSDGTFHATESIDRASISELLTQQLPNDVRDALQLRLEAGRVTSLAKAARVPDVVCADGRLRFALRYSKAHTGRWSSEILQLHNLAKPTKAFKIVAADFADAVRAGDIRMARQYHPNVLEGLSFSLRSLVVAPPGFDLIGGDFAAIEARVLAWVAGQDDTLAAFADTTRDVYVEDAANVGSDDRQFGKVQRLGLGYGMGAVKFRDTAADPPYNLVLSLKRSREVVLGWRDHNKKIVEFWAAVEQACVDAIEERGALFLVGEHIAVTADQECLYVYLPSGRAIHFWRPRRRPVTKRIEVVNKAGEIEVREFDTIELQFFAPHKGGMKIESTYSGKLVENIVQAISRDLLRDALLRLSGHPDYSVVLHVHDSIAAEVRKGAGSVDNFCSIMAEVPPWAPGLPIAVEGYRSGHFKG